MTVLDDAESVIATVAAPRRVDLPEDEEAEAAEGEEVAGAEGEEAPTETAGEAEGEASES